MLVFAENGPVALKRDTNERIGERYRIPTDRGRCPESSNSPRCRAHEQAVPAARQ